MEASDLSDNSISTPTRGFDSGAFPEASTGLEMEAEIGVTGWLHVDSFHSRDEGRVVRLTVAGQLSMHGGQHSRFALIVLRGGKVRAFRPVQLALERQGTAAGRRRACTQLRASFVLPPVLGTDPHTRFWLSARRCADVSLPLPTPVLARPAGAGVPRRGAGVLASVAVLAFGTLFGAPTIARAATAGGGAAGTQLVDTGGDVGSTNGAGTTTDSSTTTTSTTTTTTGTTTTTTGTTTTTTGTTTGDGATTATGTETGATGTGTSTAGGQGGGTSRQGGGSRGADAAINKLLSQASGSSDSAAGLAAKVQKTSALHSADGDSEQALILSAKPVPVTTTTAAGLSADLLGLDGSAALGAVSLSNLWGGTLLADPFSAAQLAAFAAQANRMPMPPHYLVLIYKQAAKRYHLPWQLLAAINYIETGYGADLNVSSAGAEGWMQFMPSTWAQYGEAVNAQGQITDPTAATANPDSPSDAVFSAARLLVANGAHTGLASAVYSYNHAEWYVQEVLTLTERITAERLGKHPQPKKRVAAMLMMAKLLNGDTYVWGGGHADSQWIVDSGYDCSGFVSAVLHAGRALSFPQTTQTLPSQPGIVSGPGRYVTLYDRTDAGSDDDHVIIQINGQYWEEGGGGPSGAEEVHRMRNVSSTYLGSFNLILHPQGL
jgi:hypothetical protein